MEKDKLYLINKIFNDKKVRTVWNKESEKYYVSIIDIIEVLTGSARPRKYWSDLKKQLTSEGSEVSEKIGQLKLKATDGKYREYETEPMDKEIIRLTGKENPNYLFMVHAQPFNNTIEEGYFETMKKIYGDMFDCSCRNLKSTELDDMEAVKEKIAWADIIYEGGGDTLEMINLCKKTGFDKVLLDAYNDGKVLCGVSAGAVCWFNSCNSDSVTSDNDVTFSSVDCLNFIDAYITPHTDENGRYESTKEELKNKDKVGIMLSNCSCIEIVDNEYRIITSEVKAHNIKEAYALRGFYQDGKYYEEKLEESTEFKPLSKLLSKT